MYITSASELLALPGFGHDRYQKIAPFVTALPYGTAINLCTASGQVLDAFIPGRQEFGVDPQGLLKNRQAAGGCFPKLSDYQAAAGGAGAGKNTGAAGGGGSAGKFDTKSNYFRLTSYITIGTTEFNLYSLLYQDGTGQTRALLRSYTPD
jgi:general secretion pathway protein K